jgi:hypothetical protein
MLVPIKEWMLAHARRRGWEWARGGQWGGYGGYSFLPNNGMVLELVMNCGRARRRAQSHAAYHGGAAVVGPERRQVGQGLDEGGVVEALRGVRREVRQRAGVEAELLALRARERVLGCL